jgi:UDPglucose 6-dehydrogenase
MMSKKQTTIGVIGYGFVGKAVSQLKDAHIVNVYDPYIEEFSSKAAYNAAYSSDIVFVCVPTPIDKKNKLDIAIVEEAAKNWAEFGREGVLAIKSTITVGTVANLCSIYNSTNIVHNPEFLSQKSAMQDFINSDEIIVGGEDHRACAKVLEAYEAFFVKMDYKERSYMSTTSVMAELVKLARNSFYATKLTFMNELYDLCDKIDIDYQLFRDIFAKSGEFAWINPMHTYIPGPRGPEYDDKGNIVNQNARFFSGACLPKDSKGLLTFANSHGVDMKVLESAINTNNDRANVYG